MNKNLMVLAGLALATALAHAQGLTPEQSPESLSAAKERLSKARVSPKERAALAHAEAEQNNGKEGTSFLAQNRTKPGVKVLASGVQYRVVKAGKGKKAVESGSVRVRYDAKLVDGTSFDKVDEKTGTVLVVKGLVAGLKEAVKLMPAGSAWEVVVPPALGYGAHGSQSVGPNAVLIYDIEVLATE